MEKNINKNKRPLVWGFMREFDRLVSENNPLAVEAKNLADKHSKNKAEAQNEYLPYLITLASRQKENQSKIKSLINRMMMAIRTFIREKLGVSLPVTTDDIVAVAEKAVRERVSGAFDPNNDDIRFSLNENDDSDFARAVDDFVAGRKIPNNITLGTTPDVLKMLGLPDVDVKIKDDRFGKLLKGKHAIKPERLKQLPKQLNDPVAVLRSSENSTNPDGYVVLTELTEFNYEKKESEPVIVALHLNKNGTILDIASAYGKNLQGLQGMINNDKVLYWHKEKGRHLKENVHRLQLPLKLHLDVTLSLNNIKTNDDLSQYQQQNKVDKDNALNNLDIQFSRMADFWENNTDKAKETVEKMGKVATDFIANPNKGQAFHFTPYIHFGFNFASIFVIHHLKCQSLYWCVIRTLRRFYTNRT